MNIDLNAWNLLISASEAKIMRSSTKADENCLEKLWNSGRIFSDSQWQWFIQFVDLINELSVKCVEEIDAITINFRIGISKYFIRFRRSNDFPRSSPIVESTLKTAFKFHWSNSSSLISVYMEYSDTCIRINEAVAECSDVPYPIKFNKWELDFEENECIKLYFDIFDDNDFSKNCTFICIVSWLEPRMFPRLLDCSNPSYLRGRRFDLWDCDLPFAYNFSRIFLGKMHNF